MTETQWPDPRDEPPDAGESKADDGTPGAYTEPVELEGGDPGPAPELAEPVEEDAPIPEELPDASA
jgi:hypothetical protein